MIPERSEDVLVVQQQANLVRKASPDGIVDPITTIERHKSIEIGLERAMLAIDMRTEVGHKVQAAGTARSRLMRRTRH